MGFAFLSGSLSFSFHFLLNINSSHSVLQALLEQLEYRYGLGEVVDKKRFEYFPIEKGFVFMPNPMFLCHCFVLMFTIRVCRLPRSISRSFECKLTRLHFLKTSYCVQIIALIQSMNFIY